MIYWYREQKVDVRWGSAYSEYFSVSNGVKQGGILSPLLFNCYMDGLSTLLTSGKSGCFMNECAMNHFMYADDVCIIAPSPKGLQKLLNICEEYAISHDILYNEKKSVCMHNQSRKVKFSKLPCLLLNNKPLKYVESYRYLGCIFTNSMCDDLDMDRQRRALYASVNIIKRKFWNCDYNVKKQLFSSYCASLYCSHLWAISKKATYNSVRVAYNNSLRILFDYDMYCSASTMFVHNGILGFASLIRSYVFGFRDRLFNSENSIIQSLANPRCLYNTPLGRHWRDLLYI